MKRVLKKHLVEANRQLEANIRELVLRPDSEKSLRIKTRVHMSDDLQKAIWFGDAQIVGPDKFPGITKLLGQ